MVTLAEFKSVTKKFNDKTPVFNVSFTIEKGSITTLVGPNGAGKTTIAKLLLGLISPTEGDIIIPLTLKTGYVPQALNFSPNLPITSEDFLHLNALNADQKSIEQYSNFIDFEQFKHKDISKLSGGQLQKLVLLATLLDKPDLVILDEPTKSLDVLSQQEFYRLLEKVKNHFGLTIFMISHDLFTVMKNSDQVICINGHICCSGKPNDLNANPELLKTLTSLGFYAHHHDHEH